MNNFLFFLNEYLTELIINISIEDEPSYCTQKVIRSDFGNESDEEEM